MSNLGKCRRERGNHHGRECIPAGSQGELHHRVSLGGPRQKNLAESPGAVFADAVSAGGLEYTISGLATVAGTGKDQIRSALKELSETGYLVKEQGHSDTGKFSGNVFILQDEAPPLLGNPTTGFPDNGKTVNGKPNATKDDNNKRR